MTQPPKVIDFPVYLSVRNSPIAWAWLIQISDQRKNSVTNFLAHAAETVLRFERLGLKFSPEQFHLQNDLFVDPYDEPRIKSIKKHYVITVMQSYYPLLFEYLQDASKEHWARMFLPLVEVYLVAFWGQATGKSEIIRETHEQSKTNYKAPTVQDAPSSQTETPARASAENEASQEIGKMACPDDDKQDTRDQASGSQAQAKAMLSNPQGGSNLDSWV